MPESTRRRRMSMAVLSACVCGWLVWLLAALSSGTSVGRLWRRMWSVWRARGVIWSDSIYSLVCSSQKEAWWSPLTPVLFSYSTCLHCTHVRIVLEQSPFSVMLFHPFVSSLGTVISTCVTLCMSSFLFPASAVGCFPCGTGSTNSLWA